MQNNNESTYSVILDVDDNLEFNKIYEIINYVTGKEYTGWMKACWPNPCPKESFRIWCPKLSKIKQGKPVSSTSGCVNYLADNGETFVYDDLNERDDEESHPYSDYDLVFAKEYNGTYKFCGVFVRDTERSKPNHNVAKRIAKKAKVLGDPIYKIEPIK